MAAGGVGLHTQRREEFEAADKPVRFYETALCFVAQVLFFARVWTRSTVFALPAATAFALLIVISLLKLLVPPRLSATRCAFIWISILALVVLVVR